MSNILEYKGYIASIEFSAEDMCLFGKIEYINDLILFDGKDSSEVESAFHEAVDSYLAFCQERGTEPNQTFKGSFNIRPGVELHRRAALEAKRRSISLNDLVAKAIDAYIGIERSAAHQPHRIMTQIIDFAQTGPEWASNDAHVVVENSSKERVCH